MTLPQHIPLSRAAAVAILLAVLALLWLGPVGLYENWRDADARAIAAAGETLARDRALVAAKEPGPNDGAAILLPAISDAEAAALLQETLKHAAQAADVEIEGMQVMPADTLAGAARVALRLHARGNTAGIARLLYSVAASRPFLYTDHLHILAHPVTAPGAGAALDFEFDVSAFRAGAAS